MMVKQPFKLPFFEPDPVKRAFFEGLKIAQLQQKTVNRGSKRQIAALDYWHIGDTRIIRKVVDGKNRKCIETYRSDDYEGVDTEVIIDG